MNSKLKTVEELLNISEKIYKELLVNGHSNGEILIIVTMITARMHFLLDKKAEDLAI